MFCEGCKKRPATMRMTLRRGDGEQRMVMVCGMCAHRFTNVLPHEYQIAGAGARKHTFPEIFSEHHFPTQRQGTFMGYSGATQEVLKNAKKVSRDLGLAYIGTLPLLIGVMNLEHPARDILEKHGVKLSELMEAAAPAGMKSVEKPEDQRLSLSRDALNVLEMAQHQAQGMMDDFIKPQHVLLGIIFMDNVSGARWMRSKGVDFAALEKETLASLDGEESDMRVSELSPEETLFGPETDKKAPGESALALYARDLTKMAEEGKLMPVIGREVELGRVTRILSRL